MLQTVPARGRGERDATTKWRSLASQPAPRPTPAAGATSLGGVPTGPGPAPRPPYDPPVNLAAALQHGGLGRPDAVALTGGRGATTFGDLAAATARLATALVEDGVRP